MTPIALRWICEDVASVLASLSPDDRYGKVKLEDALAQLRQLHSASPPGVDVRLEAGV